MKKFIVITKKADQDVILTKKGHYLVFFYNYSGRITIKITKPFIEVNIFGLYIGKDSDTFRIDTNQYHSVASSISNLLIRSILYDSAKLFYTGTIKIEKKAQKTHAYQKNENIILSDHAEVESKPDLEILADDVFCTHGSTTGGVSAEQIYYLQNRGIAKKDAESLLLQGFVKDFFDRISKLGYDKNIRKFRSKILKYLQ